LSRAAGRPVHPLGRGASSDLTGGRALVTLASVSIEQAFTWTDDGLPGWRVIDRGESAIVFPDGDRAVGPVEAIQLARHHGDPTAPLLTRTASELQEAVAAGSAAADLLAEARDRLAAGEGPTEEIERLIRAAGDQVGDDTLKRGVGMLADAVRTARRP